MMPGSPINSRRRRPDCAAPVQNPAQLADAGPTALRETPRSAGPSVHSSWPFLHLVPADEQTSRTDRDQHGGASHWPRAPMRGDARERGPGGLSTRASSVAGYRAVGRRSHGRDHRRAAAFARSSGSAAGPCSRIASSIRSNLRTRHAGRPTSHSIRSRPSRKMPPSPFEAR